jgi:glucose-6-phosphate 1-dehydrogenase
MANKELAKRQKLIIRVEPSQRALKPRNPLAVAAKQRVAGSHRKSNSAQRQLYERLLKKAIGGSEED